MSAQKVVSIAGDSHVSVAFVTVTPDTATRWLAGNTLNRTVRAAKVNQYANDMTNGRWTVSNDDLCFSPDGKLLNGQHRLLAVVKSGCTITFSAKRNVPLEAMKSMDSGAGRRTADALRFAGEKHASWLAAAIKLCVLYTDGRIYKDSALQALSPAEHMVFLDEHPDIRVSLTEVMTPATKLDANPTPIVAAHWIISRVNETALATYFFDQIESRFNEPSGSPVWAIESRLRELRRNKTVLPPRNYLYLYLKGWNVYAAGKTVRTLTIAPPKGTDFHIPAPARWSRAEHRPSDG